MNNNLIFIVEENIMRLNYQNGALCAVMNHCGTNWDDNDKIQHSSSVKLKVVDVMTFWHKGVC